MYTKHFGLSQDPFSIAPDPRFLFMSERHREALAHLLYGVTGPNHSAQGMGGGFVLLTGDIGAGKTTICRCFLEQIPTACHVAYIVNPKLNVVELLQTICDEFHIRLSTGATSSPKVCIDALNAFLLQSHAGGQGCVLIIDEAQNLAPEVLEQLRLLTNLETSERKLLQIVLIGQPELRTKLATPGLEQLAQRVIARFHLDALDRDETTHYIKHRLGVAGLKGDLPFDAGALKRIQHLSGGVPRRINLLCGRALLGAWAHGQTRVNKAIVDRAATEVFGTNATHHSGWLAQHKLAAASSLALLFVAAAAAGLMLWRDTSSHAPVASQGTALDKPQAATIAAPASIPLAVDMQVIEPHKQEDITALLPVLPQDINPAWHELAQVWKLPAMHDAPCLAAELKPWQCHQVGKLTLPQLRQLGRPGILTLQTGSNSPVYAVLVGLSERSATVQIGGQQHVVNILSLGKLWQGDFSTYWKPPAGYTSGLSSGRAKPALVDLVQQLTLLEGASTVATPASAPLLDSDLKDRVRAFQRTQGLTPDGLPGPLTLMQIERASGQTLPRLLTDTN
jgi:general secretion pathway protein A